jgi:hypothetical protein
MIDKEYRKHTFQIGMCALISFVLSVMIIINPVRSNIAFIIFHGFTIGLTVSYILRKIYIVNTDNKYITEDQLLYLGFTKIPHFTIGDNRIKDLGRNRYISLSSLGTPNEMIFLCYKEDSDETTGTDDLINLHNFDYDGYITFKRLKQICNTFPKTDENGFSRKK